MQPAFSHKLKLEQCIRYQHKIDHESVSFLNHRVALDDIRDWQCLDKPKLWRYNLHYFDYLLDDGADQIIKDKLINDWIAASAGLKEDAWEPYVLSLRIVNWVKYFVLYKDNKVPAAWLNSLHAQADVLSSSVEYHILANHYLKNGKGLFFAGAYLDSASARDWYETGKKILYEEAVEQILDDGGHYEKSPMYHCIVVEDYLDAINLIKSNKLAINNDDLMVIEKKIMSALDFLKNISMPDGDISLFNDSAFGIAPEPLEIFNYARKIIKYEYVESLSKSMCSLHDSGYYCIADGNSKLIVDCGSVSPDYQPGHTHCDVLSYELAIRGKRIVIDTGVYDYENSDARCYSRSTMAHNTITIDDREQSELWGVFRVARRVRVLNAILKEDHGSGYTFSGSYSPYWGGGDGIVHKRSIRYVESNWYFVDEVHGCGEHRIKNYIHLHPALEIEHVDDCCYISHGGIKIAVIVFNAGYKVSYEEGWYYPQFGIKEKNIVIILTSNAVLPLVQKYSIEAVH
jgi:hypothetical protein